MIKKILSICLVLGCCVGLARFTHHETRGFRLAKIRDNLAPDQVWLPADSHLPCPLLQQRYFFLSRGLQSFVFASEDGEYVIKIFNNRHSFFAKAFNALSTCPIIGTWAKKRALYHQLKWKQAFTSYRIAHEMLREEAAIIYTHLDPTNHLPSSLLLIDCLQIPHSIDPNKTGFILQRRCPSFYSMLLQYIESNETDQAQQALDALIDLFLLKYQKGIADNDPLIRTNYGFLEGRPVQIDLGPFSLNPALKDPQLYQPELRKTLQSLKNWLNLHDQSLADYLETRLDEICAS